jgi:hypothetical protein
MGESKKSFQFHEPTDDGEGGGVVMRESRRNLQVPPMYEEKVYLLDDADVNK